MRAVHLVVPVGLFCLASCGYVGPIMPPSNQIPAAVKDLEAIQRGDKIEVAFHTPPRMTDNASIKKFSEIELRIGPALDPFDFDSWADSAKVFEINPPPPGDPLDPKPIAMVFSLALEGLLGKHVAVAVRTAVKEGDHYSAWSNRVLLDVIPALSAPIGVTAAASADGVVLDWPSVATAQSYRILRQGPADKDFLELGKASRNHFVDTTSEFDTAYVYKVVAVSGTAESHPSEAQQITPIDKFPPSVPAAVTALAGPESIEVSWQRSPEGDLAGYFVYRSVNGGPFERQGDMLTLPAFSDRAVEHGKTYRYQISSVDKTKNESAQSSPAEVPF